MFSLQKSYFDVIGHDGTYSIAYWGELKAPGVSATYAQLSSNHFSQPYAQFRLSYRRPVVDRRSFEFADRADGVRGRWSETCEPPRMVYTNDVLSWELLQLRSRAVVDRDSEPLLDGLGYGERVSLNAPPWQLGIRNLKWGRYLSDSAFLMWIVADGPRPIRYGIIDEAASEDVTVEDDEVRIAGATLKIGMKACPVFEGEVFRGRLAFLGDLSQRVLGRKPQIRQSKATYRCAYHSARGAAEEGYAMSETVRFG